MALLSADRIAEYWLLNRVVEHGTSVRRLREKVIGWLGAGTYHGLKDEDLVRVLNGLFECGDIIETQWDVDRSRWVTRRPTRERVEAVLLSVRSADLNYQLTHQGAARWEELFRPNWDAYVAGSLTGGVDLELTATNQQEVQDFIDRCGFHTGMFSRGPVWKTVGRWKATYWKTLPGGERCRLRCSFKPQDWGACSQREWYSIPAEIGAFPRAPEPDMDVVFLDLDG